MGEKAAKAAMPISAARRSMRPNRNIERRAFTMLELIAVIVLMGLIAAVSMITVGGHLDRSQLIRVSQEIASADRKERDAARHSPVLGGVTIEKNQRRLQFTLSGKTVTLGDKLKINGPLLMPALGSERSIKFSQVGQSPTYAVQIVSERGAYRWVVIVGTTGQAWFSDDTEQVRSLMAMGRSS
jgi:prepilin-type N-terminal cleavage/methylation domain-containing protein